MWNWNNKQKRKQRKGEKKIIIVIIIRFKILPMWYIFLENSNRAITWRNKQKFIKLYIKYKNLRKTNLKLKGEGRFKRSVYFKLNLNNFRWWWWKIERCNVIQYFQRKRNMFETDRIILLFQIESHIKYNSGKSIIITAIFERIKQKIYYILDEDRMV